MRVLLQAGQGSTRQVHGDMGLLRQILMFQNPSDPQWRIHILSCEAALSLRPRPRLYLNSRQENDGRNLFSAQHTREWRKTQHTDRTFEGDSRLSDLVTTAHVVVNNQDNRANGQPPAHLHSAFCTLETVTFRPTRHAATFEEAPSARTSEFPTLTFLTCPFTLPTIKMHRAMGEQTETDDIPDKTFVSRAALRCLVNDF